MSNATIGTIGALNCEWQTSGEEPLGAWAEVPALAPFATGEEVRSWASKQPSREVDAVLHALLCAHQQGHQAAGRIVLQMMLGKVTRIASSQPIDSADNRFDNAVAAMWEQISTLPVRHTSSLATRLALNTVQSLADARRSEQERPVDYLEDTDVDAQDLLVTALGPCTETTDMVMLMAHDIDPGDIQLSPSQLVETTLEWVQRNRILPADDIAMLRAIHCTDDTMATFAGTMGVAPATIRQRNRRAIQRVRMALSDLVAA